MAGTIMPSPWFTGLDDSGRVVSGGKLYTYAAGTSTPLATFTDVNLTVAHPNPVILDGGGRASVFLSAASYKFVLKDANDVTIRSQDNISANAPFNVDLDISGLSGEALTAGAVVYLSKGSEAPPLTAGLWYLADADFAPKSSTAEVIAIAQFAVVSGAVGTFRLQGRTSVTGPLVPGATYYVSTVPGGLVTPAPVGPAFVRVVGIADSITSIVTASGFGTGSVVSGDMSVTGNLSVGGASTLSGAVTIGGTTTLNGSLFANASVFTALVAQGTSDGLDNATLALCGGGFEGSNRGGYIRLCGNEFALAGQAGDVRITAGYQGDVVLVTGNTGQGFVVARFFPSGSITFGDIATDPGNGNILFQGVTRRLVFDGSNAQILMPGGVTQFLMGPTSGVGTFTNVVPGGISIGVAANAPVMAFYHASVIVGSIAVTAAGTAYNTTSDARLKTDLGIPLETRVLPALVVHDFKWTADGTVGRGLFAQEALDVLPSAVTVGCEGPVVDEPWQVDYSKVVPDLIVGWQEHERRIISLLERLERVESRHDGKTP